MEWRKHRLKGTFDLRPCLPGEDLSGVVFPPGVTPTEGGAVCRDVVAGETVLTYLTPDAAAQCEPVLSAEEERVTRACEQVVAAVKAQGVDCRFVVVPTDSGGFRPVFYLSGDSPILQEMAESIERVWRQANGMDLTEQPQGEDRHEA